MLPTHHHQQKGGTNVKRGWVAIQGQAMGSIDALLPLFSSHFHTIFTLFFFTLSHSLILHHPLPPSLSPHLTRSLDQSTLCRSTLISPPPPSFSFSRFNTHTLLVTLAHSLIRSLTTYPLPPNPHSTPRLKKVASTPLSIPIVQKKKTILPTVDSLNTLSL